ncbi:DUF1934 domain-containing protein [Aerococcaceae bacterium 50-4]
MAKAGKKAIQLQVKNFIQQDRDGQQVQEEFTTKTNGYYYEVGDSIYVEYEENITENTVAVRLKFEGNDKVTIRRQINGTETTMNLVKGKKTDILYHVTNTQAITFQGQLNLLTVEQKDENTFNAQMAYNLYQSEEKIGQYQIELQTRVHV